MTRRQTSQLERLLQCPVCHDIFSNPTLLPCGHSVCGSCVETMMSHSSVSQFRCPECRCDFGQVFSLQKNFALASIIEDYLVTRGQEEEEGSRTGLEHDVVTYLRTLESQQKTLTTETSRFLQSHLTDHMDQQCRTLRDQLKDSNMLIKNLSAVVYKQKEEFSPVDQFLTILTVVLLILWLIVLYYVYNYSVENQMLKDSLKRQMSQVEEFCSRMRGY